MAEDIESIKKGNPEQTPDILVRELRQSSKKDIVPEQIDLLMASIGWVPGRGREKWLEILEKSSFVYSVYDGEKLIGFGRVVDDGLMGMLWDIMVNPAYQGKGVGTIIMNKLIDYTKGKELMSVSLFAWPKNRDFLFPFYQQFGFEPLDTGMRLKR